MGGKERSKASARMEVGQTVNQQAGHAEHAGWAEKSRSCAIGKWAGA